MDPGIASSLKLHMSPALIRKCVEAKQESFSSTSVWGTGKASREFLYVKDAAEALVVAAERYNGNEPINIGSGQECRIADLVEKIKEAVGYEGQITWDARRLDGQPRRWLDTRRAETPLGWRASTPLKKGLKETVDWCLASNEACAQKS